MAKVSNSKAGGFLGGFVIIIVGIILLWSNEGRTVKMQSAINEAEKNYTDVASDKIDPKYEGKVIATTGKLDLSASKELQDTKFGIKVTGAKLSRDVEMYQWKEECDSDDNDNNTNCTYSKEWASYLIDSSDFTKSGYNNPTAFAVEHEEFKATDVKVGAFDLTEKLLDKLSYNKDMKNEQLTELYTNTVEGYKVDGNYITNSVNPADAQIGDIRISYRIATDGAVSMLGVQKGNTIVGFTGKKGKTIYVIERGEKTGQELLIELTNSNNFMKWLLRIVGTLLVIMGIGSVFAPLNMLADRIPIVGSIVGLGTGLVSFVLGLAISLLVIAIAWFRYRPVLSIILIAAIVGLLVFLQMQKKKKEPAQAKAEA